MSTLERAILLAAQHHQGQVDKAGAPYILHPLRVMFRCHNTDAMTAAVLHDTVEDTALTLDDLRREGFSETIVNAVDCLTRRDDETYDAFTERVMANPLAREVKLSDLEDNMDLRRIADPQPKDFERLARYRRAYEKLTRQ